MSNQSNHYKMHKPEPLDLIIKYDLNFIEGNVIKYIMRSPFKGDSEGDLNKALYYAKLLKPKPNFRRIFDDSLQEYTELSACLLHAIKDTIEIDIVGDEYEELTAFGCDHYKENHVAYYIQRHLESASESEKIPEVKCPLCNKPMSYWKKGNYRCTCGRVALHLNHIKDAKEVEFNPDWLPTHPLCTLIDLLDENPTEFLYKIDKICNELILIGADKDNYLDSASYLQSFIQGYDREIEILSKIAGSKEFWLNRYNNYWEKRKK